MAALTERRGGRLLHAMDWVAKNAWDSVSSPAKSLASSSRYRRTVFAIRRVESLTR